MNQYPRIRDLREDNDLTQAQVGDYLNCSQKVYGKYDRGDADISPDMLIKLAELYHTSIDYLMGLTDEKKRYQRRDPEASDHLEHDAKYKYPRICELRVHGGFTQKQIGEYINYSPQVYSEYEHGNINIPSYVLIKLAEFHHTSVDYLLGQTDEKNPYPESKRSKKQHKKSDRNHD